MRKLLLLAALAAIAVVVSRSARRASADEQPAFLPEAEPLGELSTLHTGIATDA